MNETLHPDSSSDVPWPITDQRVWTPDTAMPAASEKATAAAVGVLKLAVQGAHDTVDRIADSAEPAVRQLGDSVTAAEEALHVKTDQLRNTGDAWVESVRTSVRNKPLVFVAAAIALGGVIARLTR